MMTADPDDNRNEAFDRWCFTAKSRFNFEDGRPLPLLTEFLYRVCGNDSERFHEGCKILRAAFEAGESAGRPKRTG